MITPEMVAAGMRVVNGIANVTVDFINKLKAKKEAAEQATKDAATAAENIALAFTAIYANEFNRLTTGTSSNAYAFVKSCWKYIQDNPIGTDKKALLGGTPQPIYKIVFVPTKDGAKEIKLVKCTRTVADGKATDTNETTVQSQVFAKCALLDKESILPLNDAENYAKVNFNMDLWQRATGFISGIADKELTAAEIEKWKNATVANDGTATPTTTGADIPPVKPATDTKKINTLWIVGGVLGFGLLGALIWALTKK